MATVPMFDPNGTVRQVPMEQKDFFLSHGGKPAVKMIDPQGTARWVPQDQQDFYLGKGGKLADAGAPAQQQETPAQQGAQLPASGVATTTESPVPYFKKQMMDYIQGIRERNSGSIIPSVGDMAQRVSDANAGIMRHFDRSWLTLLSKTKEIDQAHGLFDKGHPLDEEISRTQQRMRDLTPQQPQGSIQAGNVDLGDEAGGSLIEYMMLHGAFKNARSALALEELAPFQKLFKSKPVGAKVLLDLVEHGATGGTQAGLQGGSGSDIAANTVLSAAGGALGEAPGRLTEYAGDLAKDVKPTVRKIEGVPITQTAQEFVGPQGQPLASPRAQEAVDLSAEKGMRQEREAGFQQMFTNLAKRGIGQVLKYSNKAMADSGISPDIKKDARGGWRYYPPNGAQALNEVEAGRALNEIKQQWLAHEWEPAQDKRFQEAYDDLRTQLERHKQYVVQHAPTEAHDIPKVVDSIEEFGDAARYLDTSAQQTMRQMSGEARTAYDDLIKKRETAQDKFDRAQYNPTDRTAAQLEIESLNRQIEQTFNDPAKVGNATPQAVAQALYEQRVANANRALQNMVDKHMTLRSGTAQRIQQPRVSKNLGSLTEDVERIRKNYGDVMADAPLDHIIEFGKLLDNVQDREQVDGLFKNLAVLWKRHLGGVRSVLTTGAGSALAHTALSSVGAGPAAAGLLGAEAFHRYVVRKLATDPAFNAKFIKAVKSRVPPSRMAPIIFAQLLQGQVKSKPQAGENEDDNMDYLDNEEPEAANAASK